MTDKPTSEILYRAADLIEERGWVTGEGWGGDATASVCLEGALATVMGTEGNAFDQNRTANLCPAGRAVRDYLGMRPVWRAHLDRALWHWNDAPDRTAAEVIEVLRAAAVVEATKEQAEVREPVAR